MVTSPQEILFRIQTISLELRVLNTPVINLKKQGHHLLFCNLLTVQHLVVWELNKNYYYSSRKGATWAAVQAEMGREQARIEATLLDRNTSQESWCPQWWAKDLWATHSRSLGQILWAGMVPPVINRPVFLQESVYFPFNTISQYSFL